MANEKTLNTRILLKYDELSNWLTSTTILKKGEVAIAVIGSTAGGDKGMAGDATASKTPIVGIKVGDGGKTFAQLNWIQAIAGDVPTWAKESDWATVKADYNSAISKAISDLSSTGALNALTERVAANEGDIKELQDGVDTLNAGGTTAVGAVELITSITMENGKVKSYATQKIKVGDIFLADGTTTLATKLSNIDTELGKKAVATTVASDIQAAKEALLGTGAVEGTDTIASVKKIATDAADAAKDASDAIAPAIETAIQKLDYTDTADNTKFVSKVDEVDGKISVTRVTVTDVLGIADTYNKSSNKIATVATVTNAINALDVTDAAVADNFVTEVKQTDGKIAVQRAAITTALGFEGTYSKTSNKIVTSDYLNDKLDQINTSLADINGAMRYRGTTTLDPTTATVTAPNDGMGAFRAGDVLINSNDSREFIYNGTAWEEIGSEGIYAIKSEVNSEISGIKGRLTTNEDNIGTLTTNHNTLKGRVDTIEGAYASKTYVDEEVGKVSNELTKTGGVNERLKGAEDAIDTIEEVTIPAAEAAAKKHADDKIAALDYSDTGSGFVKAVTQTDGKIAVTKSAIALSDIAGLIKTVDTSETTGSDIASGDVVALKGYVDKKVSDATSEATDAASTAIAGAINGLSSSVTAAPVSNNQVSVLTGVTQTAGKLTAKTEVKLAAIASTASTDDLTAGTQTWIFDCGNASRDNI